MIIIKKSYKIGLLPMCSSAGATFVGKMLAMYLIEREIDFSYTQFGSKKQCGAKDFYSFGLDNIFSQWSYIPTNKGATLKDLDYNRFEKARWKLISPWQEELLAEDAYKLIMQACDEVNIFDFPDDSNWLKYLDDMDSIFFIISPLESMLLSSWERINLVRKLAKEKKVYWIANQSFGVSKNQLYRFLKVKDMTFFPTMKKEDVTYLDHNYKALYSSSRICEEIREFFGKAIVL